jgi:hypothetical protein
MGTLGLKHFKILLSLFSFSKIESDLNERFVDFFGNPASRVHSDPDRHVFIRRPLDPRSPVETNVGKPENVL